MVLTPTLECGGAEKYTATICNNLSRDLFRIILVVVNNASPFFKVREDIEVINLGKKRVSHIFSGLKSLIRKNKPDVVFTTANHITLFSMLVVPFIGHRCKWIARETSIASVNLKNARTPLLYRALLKWVYKRSDLVICQGPDMKDDLVKHFNVPERKCKVIPPGVEVGISEPVDTDLLTISRLEKEKGVDRLLNVVAKIDGPYTYVIAGDGELKEALEKKARGISGKGRQIIFAGKISNPAGKYAGAKLLLSGSHHEGFPNAVLEANAAGIPVVAFDVPGLKEVIKDGFNGFLVKDGDAEAMAKKISNALNFPFDRQKISEFTEEHFGLKTMINRTEAAILQLFAQNDG